MPSDKEEQWLERYLDHGDAQQAVREVFACSEASVPSRASQLKAKMALQVLTGINRVLSGSVLKSVHILKELSVNAQSEQVRLRSSEAILDRAGFCSVKEIRQLDGKPFDPAQAQSELDNLKRQIVKELSPEELQQVMKDCAEDQGMH